MCRKFFILFLTLMISLSMSACTRSFSDRDMDIYEKIHKTYSKMESFSADLDLTVFSNKTENRYFVAQKYSAPDKFFTRVTDTDATFSVTTITNGKVTKTFADGSEYSLTIPSEDYGSLLFVNNFFRAYYLSQQTSISVDASLTKSDKTVLDVEIPDNDLCIRNVSLSIDNKTLAPHSMTGYGEDESKLFVARFDNFKFNDKIDDTIFNVH